MIKDATIFFNYFHVTRAATSYLKYAWEPSIKKAITLSCKRTYIAAWVYELPSSLFVNIPPPEEGGTIASALT
jgi:hypothetical protein